MKASFTLLILITFFSTINSQAQQLSSDYFKENVEVYFSFEVSSREIIHELTNVISIDNVKGSTAFAYANENEYKEFLSYNLT
ncbi:MAG: hypothetical protein WBN42_03925, partial [Ignavibacteriaceae bacterium]